MNEKCLPLLRDVWKWVRSASPSQPLTCGTYTEGFGEALKSAMGTRDPNADWRVQVQELALRESDVVSFHSYGGPEHLGAQIEALRQLGRPLLCTEWMARPNSTFASCLPILQRERVHCWFWGLVNGRSQTQYSWDWSQSREPDVPFHDLLRSDGTPFYPDEIVVVQGCLKPHGEVGRS